MLDVLKKLFGSSNDRAIKKLRKMADKISALEPQINDLSDEQLSAKTQEFKQRLQRGATLDSLQEEAFAVVREASRRVLGMRPFDVQLIGGMVLHQGMVAEMKTGEGKTLVATLPAYLNALEGKGVHVVTVNDYLAQRDAQQMGKLFAFLGLTTGCIVNELDDAERREAYACDITYGTNNELGFDYLRDNMKFSLSEMVQRPFHYAIVDEVDSILIDEARTPLIISGPAEDSSDLYVAVNVLIPELFPEDYEKDEKHRSVLLTEQGTEKIERRLEQLGLLKGANLYDSSNISVVHHVNQALKAHKIFQRDVDYIVKDNKVILIDEFTGRMMDGRRYSEGLHQALEAKEKVKIQVENQTLASITFQNYFRMYPRLAGMTGTAMTEAGELHDIYKLDVLEVPTNLPCIRQDHDDEVYRTAREKYNAIITLIGECFERQQPVLVGTVSIEKSEYLSDLLIQKGIPHKVLNARYHEQEATIIAQAGSPGAITIATNMAGRGTDIKMGGNWEMRLGLESAKQNIEIDSPEYVALEAQIREEVRVGAEIALKAGGLYVIGTERHESRRIDNQLRGRSGRQADPGASKFYLSLEDDLMRIFGSDRLDGMLQRLGLEEGEAITHSWINKALARAQRKVEARNYDIRKQLLKYDDVMNDQRKTIYGERRNVMSMESVKSMVQDMRYDVIDAMLPRYIAEESVQDQWDVERLRQEGHRLFGIEFPIQKWIDGDFSPIAIRDDIQDLTDKHAEEKEEKFGEGLMRHAERSILLELLDHSWKEHLLALDHLRQGINLRAYGQKDPLHEYKREAFILFGEMMAHLREAVTSTLCHIDFTQHNQPTPEQMAAFEEMLREASLNAPLAESPLTDGGAIEDSSSQKIRRNQSCPCGSGLRYKECHGKL